MLTNTIILQAVRENYSGQPGELGLYKIHHFTTLQKFVTRIPSFLFNIVLSRTLKLFCSHGENVSIIAIDSTGFTSSYSSHYDSERIHALIIE